MQDNLGGELDPAEGVHCPQALQEEFSLQEKAVTVASKSGQCVNSRLLNLELN